MSDRFAAITILWCLISPVIAAPIIVVAFGIEYLPAALLVPCVPIMLGTFAYLIVGLVQIARHGA